MTDYAELESNLRMAALLPCDPRHRLTLTQAADALAALSRELEETKNELHQTMAKHAIVTGYNLDFDEALSSLKREVLELLPPTHGIHGGPLVGLHAVYEDGTDENTARHRGWVSHEAIAALRDRLSRADGS